VRRVYGRAGAIVSVSDGVADALATATGLKRETITTIYNPVVSPALATRAAEPVAHAWFAAGAPPVLLAVGRLHAQKNFSLLLQAFALVRSGRRVRLMILGEGPQRAALEADIERLGIGADVALPGWIANPYAYMRRASLFVLSSQWEGLPGVVIEALACGCPVVATDCPSGPREILAGGRYGMLVPVNNAPALAHAIAHTLDMPCDADRLIARADDFSVAAGIASYRRLIDAVTSSPGTHVSAH
jgi:glycosyltransferase involved in cell wall biosynthesis